MAFIDDKNAAINFIKVTDCTQANYINDNASNYEQLFDIIFNEFGSYFDCDTSNFVDSILAIFDDAILLANGIFYLKTLTSVTNPLFIVKSTITNVEINTGGNYKSIQFIESSITNVTVKSNTIVKSLTLSKSSSVTKLIVEDGSCIDILLIKACNSFNSNIDKILDTSCINEFGVDVEATFGGYYCEITNQN